MYQTIEVKPIAGNIGAEIFGVDLSKDLNQETFSEIYKAWLEHLVVFFPDQDLSIEDQGRFASRFGPLHHDKYFAAPEGHPELLKVIKAADEKIVFGENWHSDSTYMTKPPMASFLYAKEVPAKGGDTMFANQYLAYESLSPGMREFFDGLTGIHSAQTIHNAFLNRYPMKREMKYNYENVELGNPEIEEHPVVRTHPDTGRKAIYVSRSYVRRFKDWTEEESQPIIQWLYNHCTKPEFTCRYRWKVGSLGIWDNRCAQHKPIGDYDGQRRVMHRMTVIGDDPS